MLRSLPDIPKLQDHAVALPLFDEHTHCTHENGPNWVADYGSAVTWVDICTGQPLCGGGDRESPFAAEKHAMTLATRGELLLLLDRTRPAIRFLVHIRPCLRR